MMRFALPRRFPICGLFVYASAIACFCAVSALQNAFPSDLLVLVDPKNGDDSRCKTTLICQSIAYAVHHVGASRVNLSAGVFNESTVSVSNVASLVISGVPYVTVFDCSRRLGQTNGSAFRIKNSTVTFSGLTFQHCSNADGNGGAVSAVDSSVTVSRCSFSNCSAANGGAISVTGTVSGLFFSALNSNFSRNSAIGGLIGCPTGMRSNEPCSTWGGAIAAFEIRNVTVTGCALIENKAVAVVSTESSQNASSRNAVAGGGCVSVLFGGNSSASSVRISDNSFLQCVVDVSSSNNIRIGNGYGGAVSVHYGISSGMQQLSVSSVNVVLQDNVFTNCFVRVRASGGSSYGGAIAIHVGAYSSVFSLHGDAVAAVCDTLVRNVSVLLETSRFQSCSAIRESDGSNSFGMNVYGGSFSFYVGGYAWSQSVSKSSSSSCGATNASTVTVRVRTSNSVDSLASTTGFGSSSAGMNSYGGSMSVLYVGAYSWSLSNAASSSNSSSTCGTTSANALSVDVGYSSCSNCSALSSSAGQSLGSNSYGGSMNVLYVGAFSWSLSSGASSNSHSTCAATVASALSVQVRESPCSNCSALSTSVGESNGANTYGGSMNVLYVGAYSWSYSSAESGISSSTCGETLARALSVNVSDSVCSKCSAFSSTLGGRSRGAHSYGGSMSVLYVGAYSWSFSLAASSNSRSTCGTTTAIELSVHTRDLACANCSALTFTSRSRSRGANSYGGSLSVVYVGAHSWSYTFAPFSISNSSCDATITSEVSIRVSRVTCSDCHAMSINEERSYGAKSYGGSMSVLYVGSFSWSLSNGVSGNTNSTCGATLAAAISVFTRNFACFNCSSLSRTGGRQSVGANSYGGAISASYIGSYAYSDSIGATRFVSSSTVGVTHVQRLSIIIANSVYVDTASLSVTNGNSVGANVYGGAISVMVGPYVRSFIGTGDSFASCGDVICENCSVNISDASSINSRAISSTLGDSDGAFVFGGAMAFVVYPYVWSSSSFNGRSSASTGHTTATGISAIYTRCNFSNSRASSRTTNGEESSRVSASGADAIGGAVAVVVGAYMTNAFGEAGSGPISFGRISIQDAFVVINQSTFTNCTAMSLTDSSLGTSSVFGGAFAMFHSHQISNFRTGLSIPLNRPLISTGANLTIVISMSVFSECSVFSNAESGRLGEANGGGGAIYANSTALTNFSVSKSTFASNVVTVASGTTGLPSFSSGGALSIESGLSNVSFIAISSCSFTNCTARGANISNMGVRGGAVHISRSSHISVYQTNFSNCNIMHSFVGDAVSGGTAISAVVTTSLSVDQCVFDEDEDQETSETSTSLLILARNLSRAIANVTDCVFNSSAVVIKVRCVGEDAARGVLGFCVGPHVAVRRSKMFQEIPTQSPDGFNFSTIGSFLMSFQNPESISFVESSMHCALRRFASFKEFFTVSSSTTTVYSCKPCPPFQISLTASAVPLDELSVSRNTDRCFPASTRSAVSVCPFAVLDCTTFVNVTSGFWTNISESGVLGDGLRCPVGYCGCKNSRVCSLPPAISINRNRDPLCNRNRTGKLCGGCLPNFTQSMDEMTCITNEECSRNLWWVWLLSIIGFVLYSLYIVVSIWKLENGIACLLFYFQMSSFATDSVESNGLVSFLEYAQLNSVMALYEGACYAPNMSAYNSTAFRLLGPLLVLLFAVAWTWVIKRLQPSLQQRNMDLSVSYSGTLAVTFLFVFSNVSSVVFTLVECSSYRGSDAVVFIDGTVPCGDAKWSVLVFVAALLFLFPAAFAVVLRLKNFPQSARDAVCGKYTTSMFYWGAVTLTFRLLISVTLFMRVDFPNLLAFLRLLLSTGVFFLLVYFRPYVRPRTFWVDVACYVCLIAQFGLQTIATTRDFLGVSESSDHVRPNFFFGITTAASVIRVFPVVVYVIAWMKSKNSVESFMKNVGRRIAQLSQKFKVRCVALARKTTRFIGRRGDSGMSLAPISRNDDL